MSLEERVANATAKWPYKGFRRGQREAATALASTVREGGVFALSAPTGFGKTAVAVYGLLLAGVERVAYLVRTRNEIVPVLRELARFNVVDRVFLYSARRMCPLLSGEQLPVEDFWENCRLLRLRGECSYYTSLERLDTEFVKTLVSRTDDPYEAVRALAAMGYCPFFALKLLVGDSRFIVATYPYLFKPEIFETTFEPISYEDLVIVVDEAHSLLNVQSLWETRISLTDIDGAIVEIEEHGLPQDLIRDLEELKRIISRVPPSAAQSGLRRAPLQDVVAALGEPGVWRDAAEEVRIAKLREALTSGSAPRVRVALSKIAAFAEQVFQEGIGTYYSLADGRPVLVALPVEPCTVLKEPMNRAKAVALLSGTMPPKRLLEASLCIVAKRITYYDVELLHGPIYGAGTRAVLVAAEPTSRYTARTPGMYVLYAKYLLETYRATSLSVLAVYPSYEFLRSVVSALRGLAGGQVELIEEDRSTELGQVVDSMRGKKVIVNAVAGGKLVEGVEYRSGGQSLVGTVFVAGVPYPQPDDYLEDRLKALARYMGDPRARRMLYENEAIIRVRQAIGRVQRDPSRDHALIVLADTRYLRSSIKAGLRLRYDAIVYSLEGFRHTVRRYAEKLGV